MAEESIVRRLAAILAADVVGYGRLMGADEENTLARLNAHRRKAVQAAPGFSVGHMVLAAPLVRLGRLEEAKAAAARVLGLQPTFRCGAQFASVNCAPALASALSETLCAAGLPE